MATFNCIAEKNADDKQLTFVRKIIDGRDDILAFVRHRLKWAEEATFNRFYNGSFNISLSVKRGDSDEDVVIRFPIPGRIFPLWRDEKVRNEVMTMQFLSERTTIPVPKVRDWGLTEASPLQLGPFVIMDLVKGCDLSDVLQLPNEDITAPLVLNPDLDSEKLDFIYEQIAGFMLELSRLEFGKIGSISKDDVSGQWDVTGRPLTYDMNEVVTLGDVPASSFAGLEPFDRGSEYFAARARSFEGHLEAQQNIAGDDEDLAWNCFIARHRFRRLAQSYGNIDDLGPFRIFCDDLRPTNMLVNPETLRITAVLDFEFTNAMPAQFVYDPPWWLLLRSPPRFVEDHGMDEFIKLFEPRKDQFIRALERAEAAAPLPGAGFSLSAQMRESWDSGRFWFNLASRCSFDVDEIYWAALHTRYNEEITLDKSTLDKKEEFLQRKMSQFDSYMKEKQEDDRFSI